MEWFGTGEYPLKTAKMAARVRDIQPLVMKIKLIKSEKEENKHSRLKLYNE